MYENYVRIFHETEAVNGIVKVDETKQLSEDFLVFKEMCIELL